MITMRIKNKNKNKLLVMVMSCSGCLGYSIFKFLILGGEVHVWRVLWFIKKRKKEKDLRNSCICFTHTCMGMGKDRAGGLWVGSRGLLTK